MRWTSWPGKASRWLFIVVLIVATGSREIAMALEVSLTGRIDYSASDNLDRDPVGSEVSGTIISRTAGLGISEKWGPNRLNLEFEAGVETVDATFKTDEEISRINLDGHFPWSATGALGLRAETSRETTYPDPEELNQGRTLTEQSQVGINLTARTSPVEGWEADLSFITEEREDRDLMESSSGITWSTALSGIRSMELAVERTDGEDRFLENEWIEDQVSVVLNRRLSTVSSLIYRVQWDGSRIEDPVTGVGTSERVGGRVRYRRQSSNLWQQEYGVGIDRVTTASGAKYTEPRANVSVTGGEMRTARLEAAATYETQLPDPLDELATWSRNGTARVTVNWTAARNLSLDSSVYYRRSLFFVDDILGREDITTSARAGMAWRPEFVRSFGLASFSFGVNIFAEERNSDDPTYDLNERRYSINLSGTLH